MNEELESDKIFKDYLLRLTGDDFYSLINNYLYTSIKTNHKNKHDLAQKLIQFLQDEDIQEALLSYISPEDRLILTAIRSFENFTTAQIHVILPHIPYLEILNRIHNLCERLLIIYTPNQMPILNPVLDSFFDKIKLNRQLLMGVIPAKDVHCRFWLTESLIIFCLSFLFHKKKLIENSSEWETFFPSTLIPYVKLLFIAFENLNLIDDNKRPILKNLQNFAKLTPLSRLCHLLAAYISQDSKEKLTSFKVLLHMFTYYQGYLCIPGFFERVYFLLQGSLPPQSVIKYFGHCDIMHAMECGHNYIVAYQPSLEQKPSLTIESDYTALLRPHSDFILGLCLAFEPVSYDIVIRFELNKSSLFQAIEGSYTMDTLIKNLSNYLITPLPENFIDYVIRLEQGMNRAQLYEGCFLKLDTTLVRRLSYKQILDNISQEIVPGIYWLHSFPSVELLTELKNTGVDMPVRYRPDLCPTHVFFDTFEDQILHTEQVTSCYFLHDEGMCQQRLTALDNLAQTSEQKMRVAQRVILNKEQLKQNQLSQSIYAQGADYNHKVNVVQQAIQSNLYLEITLMWKDIHRTLMIIPERIERHQDGTILLGKNHATQKPVKLHIQKLLSVSTFKPSLLHHCESRQN